ncbi:immunoglobulin-like and fibronectin type III domain-containing protein 1, partial [Silurus asotus]
IRKRSKVPGVMITQFVEEVPQGKCHPDFSRKPIALTIQEGKLAIFKAIITGDPTPTVRWTRNNGDISDTEKYLIVYEPVTGEHQLQMPNVAVDQADTYKCLAENEFGRAIVTATLNVIEIGFKKSKELQESRTDTGYICVTLCAYRTNRPKEERKDGEVDERFWELLLSADKKDYERICAEYGVTDFRWMLKKLNEKKREIEEQQAQYIEYLSNLRHIEIKTPGCAQFEFEMDLRDPNAKIFLYKDGELVEFNSEKNKKHSLRQVGRRFIFTVNGLSPDDVGLYQVDVEGVNIFSTDLKIPNVDFLVKISEVKAIEREDAVFECVLSAPLPKITWMGKSVALAQSEKYAITVSEDMLIHRLLVKDCMLVDKGIYAAVVGIKSCNAWLLVEADNDLDKREKKAARKTTQAGGSETDLAKIATEQQAKLQKGREERKAMLKQHQGKQAAQAPDNAAEPHVEGRCSAPNRCRGFCSAPDLRSGNCSASGLCRKRHSASGLRRGLCLASGLRQGCCPFHAIAEGSTSDYEPNSLQRDKNHADQLGKEQAKKLDGRTVKGAGNSGSGLDDVIGRDGLMEGETGQEGKGSGKMGKDGFGENELLGDSSGKGASGKDGLSDLGSGKDGQSGDGSVKGGSGKGEVPGAGGDMTYGDETGETKDKKQLGFGQLVPDTNKEPDVHFVSGLSATSANIGETAELSCTLSNKGCDGIWYKDGQKLESTNGITISKEGALHKLTIKNCQEGNEGVYKFEAEGRKSEAMLFIEEPPKIDADAMDKFSEPVVIRSGENAIFKLPFSGKDPMKVQWFKDEVELVNGPGIRIESSSTQSRLILNKCQRKNTGEVKIKLKNEFATAEATSKLVVLGKPTPPQGPIDVIESSLSAIEFKWRPPKDDGGSPVTNYILERQQVGRNSWTKIGEIPGQPVYRDTNIDRGKKYCYRIRAKNSEGISDVIETDDIAAGTLAFPGPPASPKVVSAFKDCINLTWLLPTNTGGGSIIGYNLEKRKKGSNLWSQVNPPDEPIKEKKYAVRDVMEGGEYEFRVLAINTCGPGKPSAPSDCVFARDPQKRPGMVKDLKVTDSSYNTLCLAWTKPNVVKGVEDEVKGYFVEIRPADQLEWSRRNANAIVQTSFTITGLKPLTMYWVRVIATNEGGEGDPQGLDNYVIAMPPPVKPKFTDRKMKHFVVVKAGNTVRVSICYEASPLPDIIWLKDDFPVGKHVTITNSEKVSQLLIPTSDRSDSGIYTIIVKNMVGQETFSVEVRVTDEPKPPGEVQIEQNVEGTITLSWIPSPDEKRDDRLHYMVMKRDSVKRTWSTVADHLFNYKFTNVIMQGREYKFRVYAKNDIGLSEPSESPTWGAVKKKEKLIINQREPKKMNFQSAPKFTVPLKQHVAPKGYECYMSCAVSGNPTPHVTWYHNNVNINTNTNYYISNTCGVCSMLILMVGPKDTGEYKVVAESRLGHAESSTMLTVRG